MHSTNWCHVLHLTLHEGEGGAAAAGGGGVVITGRWEKVHPAEGSGQMHAAAYHSAVAIGASRDALLVYGGMANGSSVSHLTVVDPRTREVFHPDQDDSEASAPIGRYGAAVHDVDGKLWVIGGCSGKQASPPLEPQDTG
jgi:hypothetical protein